jgi:putative spermidine/putrescine transport system ATP-binding protein
MSRTAATDTAATAPYVEFIDVRKTYDGETLVVKGLDLAIPQGEFLTLLGPSGSGKTTSLMMLAGFETITGGDIRLAGRSIGNLPPHRRGIGMVFQNYALFPHMTVAENLAFPLSVRKRPKSPSGCAGRSIWSISATAGRPNCRAVSSSAWRWRAPWCSIRNWS